MKFDKFIEDYEQMLTEEEMTPGGGAETMQGAGQPTDMMPSAPPPIQDEEPKQMTPEGKRFVIELALKALAYDPGNIPAQDKGMFDVEVTPENAEEVLTKIEQMVGNDIERYDQY